MCLAVVIQFNFVLQAPDPVSVYVGLCTLVLGRAFN